MKNVSRDCGLWRVLRDFKGNPIKYTNVYLGADI